MTDRNPDRPPHDPTQVDEPATESTTGYDCARLIEMSNTTDARTSSGAAIRALLDRSSLGSTGARQLRDRTPVAQAHRIAALSADLGPEFTELEERVLEWRSARRRSRNALAHLNSNQTGATKEKPTSHLSDALQATQDEVSDLWHLGNLYAMIGLNLEAQSCFLAVAEVALLAGADQAEASGDPKAAALWRARATTLESTTPADARPAERS